ncbi:MAG: hypothetical protein K0S71_350 [Clostridia bacterium]|jgi:DNA invertase Pin-like site-specific DNA recombinase|nr:hypothetical protein [Clostridia bacterium]
MNVVYYARVSTEEEGQLNALKAQIEMIEEHIDSQPDWYLVDRYVDEGKSATTTKGRFEYNRLYEDLSTDKFDIVIIKDETRLNRNPLNWYQFIDRLVTNEKKLFFLSDKTFYKSDNELLMGMKAIVARQYSRDLSVKINNSQKQRMKKGRVITNGRMWGYDQIDGQLVINEKEAEIVRYVFQRCVDGLGTRKIIQELEAKGIKNLNGNMFSATTLKRMIKNEKYKGVLVCGKRHKDFDTKKVSTVPESEWVIHDEGVPAIISEELWQQANNAHASRRAKHSTTHGHITSEKIAGYYRGSHTYSGLIECGKCGRSYWHQIYSTSKREAWQCSGYRTFGKNSEFGCDNPHVFDETLDNIVKEAIIFFLKNKETNIQKVIALLNQTLENDNFDNDISRLNREYIKIDAKKDKLIDLFSEGLLSKEEFRRKKESLDNESLSITNLIAEYENKNKNLKDKKQRLLKIQNLAQIQIRNKDEITDEMIKDSVNKIIVHNNEEITVILNGNFQIQSQKIINDKYTYADVATTR